MILLNGGFTKSLKAVLFHNGNIYPSIPLTYSLQMKEDYENVKQLLVKINSLEKPRLHANPGTGF